MLDFCKICKQKIDKNNHFFREHQVDLSSYLLKYEPRIDKLTGESIVYSGNIDKYFNSDFLTKTNLGNWLKKVSKEEGLEYLKNWLAKRKKEKNLIYAPGQFECRSLFYPSIKFFHNFYGKYTYETICLGLGLLPRYDYNQLIKFQENKQLEFIIDSREQSLLNLPNKEIAKLDVGDYTIKNNNIFVERKSLNDFCNTLSQGFDRFNRELERCKNDNKYLIIMVEEKFNNINSIAYLPHTKKIKATSDFIFHQARRIINDYPLNCQIVCVDGRKAAVNFIEKVFSLENDPRTIDFQYAVDIGAI